MPEDVRWTSKAPTLIAGLILLAASLLLTVRGRVYTAIVLAFLGVAFVVYSSTIKDWCHLHGAEYGKTAWGEGGFGGGIGDCLKQKSWLQF